MKKYKVIFINGTAIEVQARNYEVDFDVNIIRFNGHGNCIARFFIHAIAGIVFESEMGEDDDN